MSPPHSSIPKVRSRAYPALTLESVLAALEFLAPALGAGQWQRREEVAEMLGHRSISGAAQRKIASLSHFGLTRKRGGEYSLSQLGTELLSARQETQHWPVRALQEAFRQVPVFREVLDANLPRGSVPRPLSEALQLQGIAPRACAKCAEIFITSAQRAEILDGAGQFRAAYSAHWLGQLASSQKSQNSQRGASALPRQPREAFQPRPTAEPEQLFEFYLSGHRKARLALPYGLTEDDMRLLQKQLELLELQMQVNHPTPVR